MEIADILHAMMEDSLRSYGLADLAVGTVVSVKPLKVKVREDMDALPEEVLWLTEPVGGRPGAGRLRFRQAAPGEGDPLL